MKRLIFITIILIAATAYITVKYFKNLNTSAIHAGNIMRTIPDDAVIVFEFTNEKSFYDIYALTNEDILDNIYNKPLPNRFCASFSKFIYDNKEIYEDYTHSVVNYAFTAFFDNLVVHYPDYQKYELNCVGSVGYSFRDVLSLVADRYEMGVGKIIRSPIDDLVDYHMSRK